MGIMKGTVEINGLRIFARHGVLPQERQVGNLFEVSAHLVYPMDRALEHDDLDGTLNYAEATEVITDVMSEPSALLEHVAMRIKNALTDRFPLIEGGSIRVAKITPPIAAELDSVAIKIEW
ncbi:MAG: dihydroneopterin aldolase [Duncaniella sp.]|nr:dihydroneopterin aldolase [Duncaniella sp.]